MKDLFLQRLAVPCDEAGEVVAFEVLPEPFDGVGIRTVGRQIDRLDVVPVKPGGLVPAGVVEDGKEPPPFPGRGFAGHRIKKDLEDFGVAVGDDEADQLAAAGVDRANDAAAKVTAVVALDGAGAAFHPFLAGARVALEAGFVAGKHFACRVGEEVGELGGEVFAPDLPRFPVEGARACGGGSCGRSGARGGSG